MGINMEYRAKLVRLFVCFSHVCLLVKMASTTVTRSIQLLIRLWVHQERVRVEKIPQRTEVQETEKKKTEWFAKFIDYHSNDIPVKVLKVQ